MTIHSSFSDIEGITLGADKEVDELLEESMGYVGQV